MMFDDRVDAGRQLALRLLPLSRFAPVVLGLPRGGVPVAAEVATALEAPLDVIIVRKLGLPSHPEVAMGAIGEEDVRVIDEELIARAGLDEASVAAVEREERATLESYTAQIRARHPRCDLDGRTALIVDDGIATGSTANAASLVARALGAERVIIAAPVGGWDAEERIPGADEVFCLLQPANFHAVGAHYRDFPSTSMDEVLALLATA